jgi:hypothetical protein
MAITRLSGGLTPADGADPRTFPAVWNGTADDLEAGEYSRVPAGGSAGEVLVKQSATDYDAAWETPFDADVLEVGESSLPRWGQLGSTGAVGSGRLYMQTRAAAKTETITNITMWTAAAAAAATPTLCKMGVYEFDPSTDEFVLVGETANDTTLFAATQTQYDRALTTPYQKVAGRLYGYAVIVISSASMPSFMGRLSNDGTGPAKTVLELQPRRNYVLSGQTDLPATIAKTATSAFVPVRAMTVVTP